MPCPQCARSAKLLCRQILTSLTPLSLTLLPTTPLVCLCAFSLGISDIRESDGSVVLLHPHVLLDVSSLHPLWVVFDTCARSAPAVCPRGWGAGQVKCLFSCSQWQHWAPVAFTPLPALTRGGGESRKRNTRPDSRSPTVTHQRCTAFSGILCMGGKLVFSMGC